MAAAWLSALRTPRRPPCTTGCRVFTRPSIISGKPVISDTSFTGRPAAAMAAFVPPVETSSTPVATRARAASISPDLSDTDNRARLGATRSGAGGKAGAVIGCGVRRSGAAGRVGLRLARQGAPYNFWGQFSPGGFRTGMISSVSPHKPEDRPSQPVDWRFLADGRRVASLDGGPKSLAPVAVGSRFVHSDQHEPDGGGRGSFSGPCHVRDDPPGRCHPEDPSPV